MKLIRTLEITSDDFFDQLERELIEIAAKSNKHIGIKDIKKGLKYTSHDDNKYSRIEVTLLEYERGRVYKSRIKSLDDTITLTYRIEPDPKGIKVTFEQRVQSFENKKQNRLMRGWSEAIYLSRMSDTLYDIQKHVYNYKNGIPEKDASKKEHKFLKKISKKN